MKLLQVILIIGEFSKYGLADVDCTNIPDCRVFDWETWSVCSGNCDFQSQNRKRYMCCDVEVKPHTQENCLLHCNMHANFLFSVFRPCRICENGGRLNSSSMSCQCNEYHGGGCCQGKRLGSYSTVFMHIILIHTMYYHH